MCSPIRPLSLGLAPLTDPSEHSRPNVIIQLHYDMST